MNAFNEPADWVRADLYGRLGIGGLMTEVGFAGRRGGGGGGAFFDGVDDWDAISDVVDRRIDCGGGLSACRIFRSGICGEDLEEGGWDWEWPCA